MSLRNFREFHKQNFTAPLTLFPVVCGALSRVVCNKSALLKTVDFIGKAYYELNLLRLGILGVSLREKVLELRYFVQ